MSLENEIQNLKQELEVQKVTNRLLFTMIIKTIDTLSPKGNVFEVLQKVAEEQKEKFPGSHPVFDDAFKQVLQIVSKKQPNQE